MTPVALGLVSIVFARSHTRGDDGRIALEKKGEEHGGHDIPEGLGICQSEFAA